MRRLGFVALLAMSACLFPSLGGLTESGDAASDVEIADAPSSDVTDSQPANDAPSSDASDASSDASDASDAGGFCATHLNHTFCEDFDEPNFQSRWDNITVSTGATVAADNSKAVSPPSSMLASFTCPANGSGHAYAMKHFATANTIKVQAQLMVDPTTLTTIDPLMIVFNPPPAGYTSYEIHIDISTAHLGYVANPSDGGSLHVDTTFANALAAWHNVELDLNMSTAAIAILVDGVPTVQWTVAPVSPTAFDLRLGIATATNNTGLSVPGSVHVDDVLVDVQ